MSHNSFFIADTHFGHKGMVEFLKDDGSKMRPFTTIEEHDETLISNWNSVVRPKDRVYHLGDVVMNKRFLPTIARLNGRKKLIKGNHDVYSLKEYTPYFEDIYGVYVLKDMILSHIPVHPDCLKTRYGTNVHGHLHSNIVLQNNLLNPKYLCVSCEHTNYTPISIDEVRAIIKSQS